MTVDVKPKVMAELKEAVHDAYVIASNTSTSDLRCGSGEDGV